MTNSAASQNQSSVQRPLPAWIVSGVVGVMLGGGATFLGLQYCGFEKANAALAAGAPPGGAPPGMGGGGMGGMGGGGMGGMMGGGGMGGGGMGGSGMGGSGMGGGGMGGGGMGGGGPRGKRNLTTLVGKLDLASKGIPFQFDQEQSTKLTAQLGQLEHPETMTQEEAQERCDAMEAMLTDEQKETLASFELPRAGRGVGGGGGAGGMGGAPGGGGPPPATGGAPGAGAPDDSNPFQDETNQTRLHSLLDRLKGTAGDTADEAIATDSDTTKETE